MATTLITGPARSGKTTALRDRYLRWLRDGVRTDQILILTHGAGQTAPWLRGLDLPATGPIEAHDFYGFIRQELTLHWPALQAVVPAARKWLAPAFLPLTVERHLLQALLEPHHALFGDVVKSRPERLALQLLTRIDRVAAGAGLGPEQAVLRMAEADRPEKRLLYGQVAALLDEHRSRCLHAGLLDYGLALTLFTDGLLPAPEYRRHLQDRFRRLLVDDLDEAVPVELDFVAALAEAMEEAALALDPEGGHDLLRGGGDPDSALTRFSGAVAVSLPDPVPDLSARLAALGLTETAAAQPQVNPGRSDRTEPAGCQPDALSSILRGTTSGSPGAPGHHPDLTAEFWGDMVARAAGTVADLVGGGVSPGDIAVIAPRVDNLLAAALGRALADRGVPLQPLVPTRRLVDEPAVRTVVALGGLAVPAWRPPWPSAGAFADAARLLLRLDPEAAARLGEALWQAGDGLPDPAGHPAPYRRLYAWLKAARHRRWQTDTFVRAALLELLLPLRPDLPQEAVDACRQLLKAASDFRLAAERLGEAALGPSYRPLLTEATAPLLPPREPPAGSAVLLTTPRDFLARRLTAAVQVWLDVTSSGWLPSGVSELANPHVLAPGWPGGAAWTDAETAAVRERTRCRTVRALLRRCTGRVITAAAALSPWVQEQEGGLWA